VVQEGDNRIALNLKQVLALLLSLFDISPSPLSCNGDSAGSGAHPQECHAHSMPFGGEH
jgi:hypothetical protein